MVERTNESKIIFNLVRAALGFFFSYLRSYNVY